MKDLAIEKMKAYFGSDQKRINHALKVTNFAAEILHGEQIEDEFLTQATILAAVFHDIGIHEAERKYNSSAGKFQELEGPPIARKLLEEMDVAAGMIDRVCYIVGHHHTQSKIDGIDFQILWEADLLVNLEEEGLYDKVNPAVVIPKNFKTTSGVKLAEKFFNQV